MLITKQAIANLQTTFSQIYASAWSETPTWYQRIASTIPSSTKTNTYGWMQRILQMREWIGPRQFQNLNTHAFTVENKDWELTVKVPRNDFEDDNLGIWNPLMAEMGRQGRKLPDVLVLAALRAGSDATALGFDGVPFFDANHPLNPAGVQSNEGSENLDAAGVGFDAVRTKMLSYKGEDGLPLGVNPNLLVGGPVFETRMKQILVATQNSAGATNVLAGTMNYLVIPEMTLADGWFMFDVSKGLMPAIFQLRKAIEMQALTDLTDANVFFNREFIWGQDGRAVASYGPWFLAYHSTGNLG